MEKIKQKYIHIIITEGESVKKKRDTRALYETAVSNPESIRLKTYVEKRHLTRWHQGQVCRAISRQAIVHPELLSPALKRIKKTRNRPVIDHMEPALVVFKWSICGSGQPLHTFTRDLLQSAITQIGPQSKNKESPLRSSTLGTNI